MLCIRWAFEFVQIWNKIKSRSVRIFPGFGFYHFSTRSLWENAPSQKFADGLIRSGGKFQGVRSPEDEKTPIFPAVFEINAKNGENQSLVDQKPGIQFRTLLFFTEIHNKNIKLLERFARQNNGKTSAVAISFFRVNRQSFSVGYSKVPVDKAKQSWTKYQQLKNATLSWRFSASQTEPMPYG